MPRLKKILFSLISLLIVLAIYFKFNKNNTLNQENIKSSEIGSNSKKKRKKTKLSSLISKEVKVKDVEKLKKITNNSKNVDCSIFSQTIESSNFITFAEAMINKALLKKYTPCLSKYENYKNLATELNKCNGIVELSLEVDQDLNTKEQNECYNSLFFYFSAVKSDFLLNSKLKLLKTEDLVMAFFGNFLKNLSGKPDDIILEIADELIYREPDLYQGYAIKVVYQISNIVNLKDSEKPKMYSAVIEDLEDVLTFDESNEGALESLIMFNAQKYKDNISLGYKKLDDILRNNNSVNTKGLVMYYKAGMIYKKNKEKGLSFLSQAIELNTKDVSRFTKTYKDLKSGKEYPFTFNASVNFNFGI